MNKLRSCAISRPPGCSDLKHPGLTSQRHSALISSDSEYFQVCFSAVHYLKISEQRWKRKFSELKISAETALIFSETELIQSWTALIFSETELIFSEKALKHQIFRAKNQRWIRAVSALFFLKQSWTALIFSETELIFSEKALKHQIFRAKNQRWIRAVSALFSLKQSWTSLIFAETELITTKAFWNSSYHSWSSPETTLNIPEICLPFLVLTRLLQFFYRET